MELMVREQIKVLLAQEQLKIKELAKLLTKETGREYSENGLSQRLRRGSFTYNEVVTVCKILGYKIQFTKEQT